MSAETDGTQAALELFDLSGIDELDAFAAFVDEMRTYHVGADNAIQSGQLAEQFLGDADRTSTIRDWKQAALQQLGLPIAYAHGRGYYVVDTEDELEDALDRFYKEISQRKETAEALERAYLGTQRRSINAE